MHYTLVQISTMCCLFCMLTVSSPAAGRSSPQQAAFASHTVQLCLAGPEVWDRLWSSLCPHVHALKLHQG